MGDKGAEGGSKGGSVEMGQEGSVILRTSIPHDKTLLGFSQTWRLYTLMFRTKLHKHVGERTLLKMIWKGIARELDLRNRGTRGWKSSQRCRHEG